MTRALLDSNILIASESTAEPAPDLGAFEGLAVSTLSWAELTKGLHSTTDLIEFKARLARYSALRDLFGSGIPFDDRCVSAYDTVLRHITAHGGLARAHVLDRMLAATALAHDLVIVTRDTTGFVQLGGLVHVESR